MGAKCSEVAPCKQVGTCLLHPFTRAKVRVQKSAEPGCSQPSALDPQTSSPVERLRSFDYYIPVHAHPSRPPSLIAALVAVFVVSGAAGLVYESIWSRYL